MGLDVGWAVGSRVGFEVGCFVGELVELQVSELKDPAFEHVAVPPPVKPVLHTTVTVEPVTPAIEPTVAWSEFATSVAAHALAVHVSELKDPAFEHSAVPPPVKPVLQTTATVDPATPAIDPALAWSEFDTDVDAHDTTVPTVGALVGCLLGDCVGLVGARDGDLVGMRVGLREGLRLGEREGAFVGILVGNLVGCLLGDLVGAL